MSHDHKKMPADASKEEPKPLPSEGHKKKKGKPSRQMLRHHARSAALQALYGWSFHRTSAEAYAAVFLEEHPLPDTDIDYFKRLLEGAINHVDALDALIEEKSSSPLASLNPIELAGLRLAALELRDFPDVPYRVVINEALKLNKAFGSEQGFRFVNAVLDKLAKTLRPHG